MISRVYDRILERLREMFLHLSPAWKGAGIAVFLVGAVLWVLFSYGFFLTQPRWLSTAIASLLGVATFSLIAVAIVLALGIISTLPRFFVWAVIASLLLFVYAFDGLDLDESLNLAAYALPITGIVGAALGYVFWGWNQIGPFVRTLAIICLTAAVAVLGVFSYWMFSEGNLDPIPYDASSTKKVAPLDLPDPSAIGPYKVLRLTYGSGKDNWRKAYGKDVNIVTEAVNGRNFVSSWNGWAGWWRTRYWGFDTSNLPRNALVWYPEGDGPFPLVLIVHGNTMMEKYSEGGYGYLGELLASRGYIVASVDENFLNSSWHGLWQGIGKNNGRAWLLLEHLKLWRDWNIDAKSPFFQKVDMQNIALMGHSRGGEAVALASTFNKLPYYPDDCNIAFDYNFNIKALVAIAPVDGQYQLTGRSNWLSNVNYLLLHGSSDADVRAFEGASQYQRIKLDSDEWFKASVYIYGANHGQFNTHWGRYDQGQLEGWLLNVAPLMAPEEQRKIAQVYISAFLDTTLKGGNGYKPLFRDHRTGRNWLPSTIYITQYADGSYDYIANLEEDMDPTKTTVEGGRQYGVNLTTWREYEVCLKYGCMDTNAVFLGWNNHIGGPPPGYHIEFPENAVKVTKDSSLVFVMADALNGSYPEGVDLTVEVGDSNGESARLPLSHYSDLQPSLRVCIWKSQFLPCYSPADNVFQSFAFPMRDFLEVNPRFIPELLTEVNFLFDRTPSSEIILDDIGVRPY
jgi:dienelactone hydrolase